VAKFKTGWAFINYSETVRTKYRFAYPPEVTEFLQTLVATSKSRIKHLPANYPLWRAQLGHDIMERQIDESDPIVLVEDAVPFSAERMKPRRNAAHEGRANSKGIPCLYVATDKVTAMSEVRPWIGAQISLGHFRTTRDLKLVDFSLGHDLNLDLDLLFGKLPAKDVLEGVWAQVDRAFSEPISDDTYTAEYAPTQVIAEVFRREGLDGLVYKSMLGEGFNMALFDLNCAELVTCSLYKTEKVSIQFNDECQTYYVKKQD